MKRIIDKAFDQLGAAMQVLIAGFMGLVAHIDTCASILAVLVLIFQLRASYYRSVRQKIELMEKRKSLES